MSWTCPRCQQPVFFGEAWVEKGEKTGQVRATGFPEDARSWRLVPDLPSTCGLLGTRGGMELASRRHSPSPLGARVGGNKRGKEGAFCLAWLPSARFHLVLHSRESELAGQELAPILPEM